MMAAEDLLLYPLMTEDHPVCPRCSSPLVLVGFQGERGKPDLSSFRCPDCGRSETFAEDDGTPLPMTIGTRMCVSLVSDCGEFNGDCS